MKGENGPIFPPLNDYYYGVYLFDITDMSVMLRTPEFLNIVSHKFFDNIAGELNLKNKYTDGTGKIKNGVVLQTIPSAKGIEITQEIIDVIIKKQSCNMKIPNAIGFNLPIKYGLLGKDQIEPFFDRINNLIYSGRCDRIICDDKHKNSPTDKLVLETIRHYSKQQKTKNFKTARIHVGYGEWKTVVVS